MSTYHPAAMTQQQKRARRIRYELEVRGYTLAALGAELGISRQTVSKALRRPAESRRVRERITEILGRDPWPRTAA